MWRVPQTAILDAAFKSRSNGLHRVAVLARVAFGTAKHTRTVNLLERSTTTAETLGRAVFVHENDWGEKTDGPQKSLSREGPRRPCPKVPLTKNTTRFFSF